MNDLGRTSGTTVQNTTYVLRLRNLNSGQIAFLVANQQILNEPLSSCTQPPVTTTEGSYNTEVIYLCDFWMDSAAKEQANLPLMYLVLQVVSS